MSFSSLKNNRSAQKEKLLEKLQGGGGQQYQNQDERYWKLTTDKLGVGSAVIRFLPPSEGEEDPYIKVFDHGFQGPTGLYYIEKSLSTIGQADPLGEMNRELWATDIKENQETVRQRKRRLKYVSNIYVVDDPAKPENNGKVFLYAYGIKIFDKIKLLLEDDKIDAYDLWEGANFRLKAKKVDKFPNYDQSSFARSGPLFDDDDKLEMVWKQQYKLLDEISVDKFKSYAELKQRLNQVLGLDKGGSAESQADRLEMVTRRAETPAADETTRVHVQPAATKAADASGDEDDMSWFDKFRDDDDVPF